MAWMWHKNAAYYYYYYYLRPTTQPDVAFVSGCLNVHFSK